MEHPLPGTVKQLLGSRLLLGVLHGVGGPRARLVGVLVELPAGAPLGQQLPALVELLLQLFEPPRISMPSVAQPVVPVHPAPDPPQDVTVVAHGTTVTPPLG